MTSHTQTYSHRNQTGVKCIKLAKLTGFATLSDQLQKPSKLEIDISKLLLFDIIVHIIQQNILDTAVIQSYRIT